jgi:hypothetical protein
MFTRELKREEEGREKENDYTAIHLGGCRYSLLTPASDGNITSGSTAHRCV